MASVNKGGMKDMKYYRVIPKDTYTLGSNIEYKEIDGLKNVKCLVTDKSYNNIYTYYINKKGYKVSTQLIANELFTYKELIKLGLKQHINLLFEEVEISKNNIHWFFGARFENDYKNNPEPTIKPIIYEVGNKKCYCQVFNHYPTYNEITEQYVEID